MSLPLPPPPSHRDAYLIGEVEVHPNAVIALGVLLLAEPGSKITIAAGVCIGMGSILHASGGVLEICEGVNLGTGVLLIGAGKVSNYACVGSSSTIINPDLKVAQVLPPGTLLGDASRAAETLNGSAPETVASVPEAQPIPQPASIPHYSFTPAPTVTTPTPEPIAAITTETKSANQIYGRDYVQRMLQKLHPPSITPITPEAGNSAQT
jgi:carbon dioxide concentrating mechanism protein CcmN